MTNYKVKQIIFLVQHITKLQLTAKVKSRKDASSEGSSRAWPEMMASHSEAADSLSKSCLLRLRNSSMVFVLMSFPVAWQDHLEGAFLLQWNTLEEIKNSSLIVLLKNIMEVLVNQLSVRSKWLHYKQTFLGHCTPHVGAAASPGCHCWWNCRPQGQLGH